MGSIVPELLPTTADAAAETLNQTGRTRVLRRSVSGAPRIFKHPLGPGAGERLRHERAMLERLMGVPGIVPALEDPSSPTALVFDDPGGIALSSLLKLRRLETGEVLRLGLALARVVALVHARGILHKDINPANVLVGEGPLEVYLIDFDLASTFAEERLAFTHLSELIGTLPYMAPEQTGRTGRFLDSRADLYSLGATLYSAATGRPPFEGDAPLQLVHDHLARTPVAPDQVDPKVPRDFSRIVMRLLEKEPDARYQSADGLVFDLAAVYQAWVDSSDVPLTLGERDFPARLRPPSRLVGRTVELAVLRRSFDEVVHGACGMVLVSGAPGVGKSALMDEVRAWVTPAGGLFAAGKFDAVQQDGEADGVRQALRAVLRLLLAEPEAELAQLRERLRKALGINAPLAAAMLPEVAHLLQVAAPDAAHVQQTRENLQQTTQLLLRSLSMPGRPIVLVIDDLQWAPGAALDMLDAVHLDVDMRGVMVMGSYRHNEVDVAHPLRTMIARWRRLGFAPRELHLDNLQAAALTEMLGECLRLSSDDARALGEAILPLSGGNPFDTLELIDSLRRDGVLRLEPEGWRWDAQRIHRHLEGRNVEALVAQRLEGIPAATTLLLDSMACIGGQVPLERLRLAAGIEAGTLHELLAPALRDGLLVLDRTCAAVQFRHDRVLQALIARLELKQRAILQRNVARRLATHVEHANVAAEIYLQIVDRLGDAAECAGVVTLFRTAATQARLALNWAQLERYAREAIMLLARSAGPHAPEQFRLHLLADRHAALYGLGRLAEADAIYAEIVAATTDPLQRAEASWIQISSLTQRDRPREAVALALDLLRDLGLEVPANAAGFAASIDANMDELYSWQRDDVIAENISRPECRDARALATARTLNRSIPSAYYSDHQLMSWLILAAARLWREQGAAAALIGPLSHSAFVTIALRGDHLGGHDIVRRVIEIADARGYELDGAQARFTYAMSCAHWAHPLEYGVAESRAAQEVMLRAGELQFGYGAYYSLLKSLTDCAESLEELESAATTAVDASRRLGNEQAGATFLAYRQFARSMRGSTRVPGEFTDDSFDEDEYQRQLAANPVGMVNYRLCRALAALIAGDLDGFVAQQEAAAPLVRYVEGTWFMATAGLLQALSLAYRARRANAAARPALVHQLERERDWFAARARDAPANCLHLLRLIEAELAWVNDDFRAAAQGYDAAWELASERSRPWHRGVILEQAARCRVAHGMDRTANLLLQRARVEYAAWGAEAKCLAMGLESAAESRGTHRTRHPGTHRSGSLRGGEIDLLALLTAAQQLQAETDPDRLLDNVSTVVSALSGATSVRLALWSEEARTWFASVKTDAGERRDVPFEQAVAEQLLPSSAFRYAQRTREPLVVDDAITDERFRRDPYFAAVQRCSLLLVPVLSRGALKAMLVIENRKAKGVFSAHRLDGVLLIAGQLATSLENALLADSIERRVAQRVQDLGEDNERLTQLSQTDALTGLANRRHLDAQLAARVADAASRGESIAVAMIDVDHFKQYNDCYGHSAGDECLARIAALLRESARGADLVARYGGEEFVLVLAGADAGAALRSAERAREHIAAHQLPHQRSPYGVVTLSVGVAALVPVAVGDAARLLHLADQSLYEAKGLGRNRVVGASYS